jgi:hypothetical protein
MTSPTASHRPSNGSATHHAPPQELTSILLQQSYRTLDSIGEIKTTLAVHGARLTRLESPPGTATPPALRSRRALLTSWAAGLVRTPKDMKDTSCVIGMMGGFVELITGAFGLVDGITNGTVAVAKVLMQAAM